MLQVQTPVLISSYLPYVQEINTFSGYTVCICAFFWLFSLFLYFQLDSLEKLSALIDACRELGVQTGPMFIDGLGIIPLFSWYHEVMYCCIYGLNLLFLEVKLSVQSGVYFLTLIIHLLIKLLAFQSFDKEKDITGIRMPSLEMVIPFSFF